MTCPSCAAKSPPAGLSLLEVVLALVILATSMVAIGQLMTIGAQHSNNVRDLARGQQYAQSLLDSVAVGVLPLQSTGWTNMANDPEWEYALSVDDNGLEGLQSVTASVQLINQESFSISDQSNASAAATAAKPSTVQLQRWILDPLFVQDRMLNASLIDQVIIDEMIAAESGTDVAAGSGATGRSATGPTVGAAGGSVQ